MNTTPTSSIDTIGSVTVSKSTVCAYLEAKGIDPVAKATEYIQAWKAKVPLGTQMIMAKMKCALADGPCGCPEDSSLYKCTGPYLPVPIEILLDVMFPPDGSPCAVEGVECLMLPAPEAIVVDGHVHEVEFVSSNVLAKYIKKTA
jgi:hypothetical protein